jgi:GNAT superfamily N-acetyltransferase
MHDTNYTIRTMERKEINLAVEWGAREGWNPGLHDSECYSVADPNGFLIGLLGDEPISTVSAIRYDASFGFLGFYIVKPECRGKGYGIQIANAAFNRLEGRNMGLDGVVEQQENYKRVGFKLAHRNIRYQGTGGSSHHGPEIFRLSSLPFETVDTYDRPFSPAYRPAFIKSWISQPDSHALGIMQNGNLAGYGVIRQCRTGFKIGPLYADNPELAESLFLALISQVGPSEQVYLDVPEINREAVALAHHHKMTVSFETARMYNEEVPRLPLHRVFGVTSFEIG